MADEGGSLVGEGGGRFDPFKWHVNQRGKNARGGRGSLGQDRGGGCRHRLLRICPGPISIAERP